jgi:hypothetical protein
MLTDEQLCKLEETFGRIHEMTGKVRARSRWAPPPPAGTAAGPAQPPYQVVFRKPTPGEYSAFRAAANAEGRKARSQEDLARATIIAVSTGKATTVHDGERRGAVEIAVREAFDRLLDDYPGVAEAAADGIGELAGMAKEEQEK